MTGSENVSICINTTSALSVTELQNYSFSAGPPVSGGPDNRTVIQRDGMAESSENRDCLRISKKGTIRKKRMAFDFKTFVLLNDDWCTLG